MWEHGGTIIALLAFLLQLILIAVGGTRALGRMEARITKTFTDHQKETDDEFALIRREFGETVSAAKEKIREVELYVRDTYMRRDSFNELNKHNAAEMKNAFDKIEARLERMENKIDSKT